MSEANLPAETPEAEAPAPVVKKWWESKGIWGSIVAVAALAAGFAGYNIDDTLQQEIVTAVSDVIALGGVVMALIGRAVATKEIRG
jgi:hypothetical protein